MMDVFEPLFFLLSAWEMTSQVCHPSLVDIEDLLYGIIHL